VLPLNCPYLVTFDLDLEHTLDGDTTGDHSLCASSVTIR